MYVLGVKDGEFFMVLRYQGNIFSFSARTAPCIGFPRLVYFWDFLSRRFTLHLSTPCFPSLWLWSGPYIVITWRTSNLDDPSSCSFFPPSRPGCLLFWGTISGLPWRSSAACGPPTMNGHGSQFRFFCSFGRSGFVSSFLCVSSGKTLGHGLILILRVGDRS